ncbi:hypothetical protein [Micromonospora sp. NPDC049204]|uniref:hypothetical protein n=1 Tax=Micromonospora sp. NPDC049204 TaxID=3154351 RepID=UPI0033D0E64D
MAWGWTSNGYLWCDVCKGSKWVPCTGPDGFSPDGWCDHCEAGPGVHGEMACPHCEDDEDTYAGEEEEEDHDE